MRTGSNLSIRDANKRYAKLLPSIACGIVVCLVVIWMLYARIHEDVSSGHETRNLIQPVRSLTAGSWSVYVVEDSRGLVITSTQSANETIYPRGTILLATEATVSEDGYFEISFPVDGVVGPLEFGLKTTAIQLPKVAKRLLVKSKSPSSVKSSTVDNSCNPELQLKDVDFKGFDLPEMPLPASTMEDCCYQCTINPLCGAWTLAADKTCWLKSTEAIQHKSDSIGLVSGICTNHKIPKEIAVPVPGLQAFPFQQGSEVNSNIQGSSKCCASNTVVGNNQIDVQRDVLAEINHGYKVPRGSLDSSSDSASKVSDFSHSSSRWNLAINRKSSLWTNQWLIGNGKAGAMIGGTIDYEIIPLSVAELYGWKKDERTEPTPDNFNLSPQEAFVVARKKLLQGEAVGPLMKQLQQSGLGKFQYIADMVLLFAPLPMEQVERNKVPTKASGGTQEPHIVGRSNLAQRLSREFLKSKDQPQSVSEVGELLVKRKGLFAVPKAVGQIIQAMPFVGMPNHPINPSAFGESYISNGLLDMKHGITYANFLSRPTSQYSEFDDILHLHHREWFASELDDVIVGRMTCKMVRNPEGSNVGAINSTNCINIAIDFSRQFNAEQGQVKQTFELADVTDIAADLLGESSEYDVNGMLYSILRVDVSIQESETVDVPSVHTCGLVVCARRSPSPADASTQSTTSIAKMITTSYGTQAITCDDVAIVDIMLSVDIYDPKAPQSTPHDSKARCWSVVTSAAKKGQLSVRDRHMDLFAQRMMRTDVEFNANPTSSETCELAPIEDRLKRLAHGCGLQHQQQQQQQQQKSPNKLQTIDHLLLSQAYHFGRYLLFSSATKTVANLQGLWADGPTSAWNGDYHLNINLQQIYWASNVAAMPETIKPLLSFLTRMVKTGQKTSRDLYNCSHGGWVAHGFTDSRLNAAPLGDSMWSLCVTCGAWVATQLFDYLTYTWDPDALLNDVLPALRGAAEFFLEYAHRSDNGQFVWTGPTTSPENSYHVFAVRPKPSSTESVQDTPMMGPKQQEEMPVMNVKGAIATKQIKMLPKAMPKPMQSEYYTVVSDTIEHLAMSPAIDLSILRQLATALSLSVSWAQEHLAQSGQYHYLEDDKKLVARFGELVHLMHNSALPTVGKGNGKRIVEYPSPMNDAITGFTLQEFLAIPPEQLPFKSSRPDGSYLVVDESLDVGHRHFSAMHWLYPNHFHVQDKQLLNACMDGGRETMFGKRRNNGGHTSWSSAWESCLWARLRDGDQVLQSLSRILKEYSAPNMLSLHPPLARIGDARCDTCFTHSGSQPGADIEPQVERGMSSADGSKFQLDGNLGLVAGLSESLLQTHVPGYILLLPAIPSTLAKAGGAFYRLRGRGNVEVTAAWEHEVIIFAALHFRSLHPWLQHGIQEMPLKSGVFASSESSSGTVAVSVAAKNKLFLIDAVNSPHPSCAQWEPTSKPNLEHSHWTRDMVLGRLLINRFPCMVSLCDADRSSSQCAAFQEKNANRL